MEMEWFHETLKNFTPWKCSSSDDLMLETIITSIQPLLQEYTMESSIHEHVIMHNDSPAMEQGSAERIHDSNYR